MLEQRREDLLSASVESAFDVRDADEADAASFGKALYRLARNDLDRRTVEALQDDSSLLALVEELVLSGKPRCLPDVAIVALATGEHSARLALAYLTMACGLCMLDQTDEAALMRAGSSPR